MTTTPVSVPIQIKHGWTLKLGSAIIELCDLEQRTQSLSLLISNIYGDTMAPNS